MTNRFYAVLNGDDIVAAKANQPPGETLGFVRVSQDRRNYYGLTVDGRRTGSLTTAEHARQTIAYWQTKGWIA